MFHHHCFGRANASPSAAHAVHIRREFLSNCSCYCPQVRARVRTKTSRSWKRTSPNDRRGHNPENCILLPISAGCSFLDYEDRKSTRLNSSHEWISYAVFCLKKKNLLNLIKLDSNSTAN